MSIIARIFAVLALMLSNPVAAWADAGPESAFPTREYGASAAEGGAEADPVAATIARLGLRERIAQLLFVTAGGLQRPSVDDLKMLQRYTPGGMVIPKLLNPAASADYVNRLRAVEQGTGIPLFVGADLYGLARRERGAPSDFLQLPTLLSLAAARNDEATRATAGMVAHHMATMGFTVYLGPNLELAPTLPDAPGSVDCFGSDPDFVAQAGLIFREVLADAGVLAMPMGFPGGGANRTGKSPAVLLTPRQTLRDEDLKPYIALIEGGAGMIHVANTMAPTLDEGSRPASISPVVIGTILRRELGFDGVVVAGPLDDEAVTRLHDPAEAAMMALLAGADMVYFGGSPAAAMRVVDKIAQAILDGRFPETRVLEALERVLRLKHARVRPGEVKALRERDAVRLNPGRSNTNEVYAIERQAITLVQNRGLVLPLTKDASMPVGVTGVLGTEIIKHGLERHMKPVSQQQIATARQAGEIHDFEIHRITSRIRGMRTIVVVLTDTLRPQGQIQLVRELKQQGIAVVVVLLGYPASLAHLSAADAIVLAYSDTSTYDVTLRAVADTLVGHGAIGFAETLGEAQVKAGETRVYNMSDVLQVPAGRLPVTVSDLFTAGLAVPYAPSYAVKRAEWQFGDTRRRRAERVEYAFPEPGRYPVTLTVTDQKNERQSHTFMVNVE